MNMETLIQLKLNKLQIFLKKFLKTSLKEKLNIVLIQILKIIIQLNQMKL